MLPGPVLRAAHTRIKGAEEQQSRVASEFFGEVEFLKLRGGRSKPLLVVKGRFPATAQAQNLLEGMHVILGRTQVERSLQKAPTLKKRGQGERQVHTLRLRVQRVFPTL